MSPIPYFYTRGTPAQELSNGIIEVQTIDFTSNYNLRIYLGADRFNEPGRYSIINYDILSGGSVSNILVYSTNFNVSNVQTIPVTGYTYPNMITVDLM